MANLKGDIKKWKRGEFFGTCATVFCGIVLIYFAVCFTVARITEIKALELVAVISAPILLAAGVAVAAFCGLKYGGALDKAVKNYVLDVCVENAALMHPERNSLSFYVGMEENIIDIQVNGYKEKLVFDFTDYGKLSLTRKVNILTEIENRLCVTFCRLYDRGANYTEVGYAERAGTRRKSGKTIYIIKDGKPDEKAYKQYLKNK